MLPYTAYEQKLLDLIRRQSITTTMGALQNQRVVLGGIRGTGGGEGGPIQPFVGKLPQTQVTFDTDEFALNIIPSGEQASLLDNLNRIRYAVTIIPSGGAWIPNNYLVPSGANLIQHLGAIDDALGEITATVPLFMYDDASADIPGYRLMQDTHSPQAESTVTAAGLASGDTLIDEWVTPSGSPNMSYIPEGVYHTHVHAKQTAGTKNAALFSEVYKRTIGSVETLLATSHESLELTGDDEGYDLHGVGDGTTLNTSDRIVLKVYAQVTGAGNAPTVELYMEGHN